MTDHDHTDDKQQQEPPSEGGSTAPQDVDNPGERTTPPANGDHDESRVDNVREDQERTIAK